MPLSPYNNNLLKDRRKELRKKETEAEKVLWDCIRNKKLEGYKFFRQYSVGGYILDFYCPKLRLAIELDGSQHKSAESVQYDKERNEYLKNFDIETIRFWNDDILNKIKISLRKIEEKISELE